MAFIRCQAASTFPGAVEVRCYDTLSPQVRAVQAGRLRKFEEHRWPYPVSLVGGEVVSIGSLSAFSLLQAVERARRRSKDGER